jgi:hypothetical protein
MSDKKEENIWQAFERVLEEHGPLPPNETPEDAAGKWVVEYWDEEGNELNELMQVCGSSGFLAGVKWAEERGRK